MKTSKDGLKYDEAALLQRIVKDYAFAKRERETHVVDWQKARDQFDCKWNELEKTQDDEELKQWFYVPKTLMTIHRLECELLMHFFGPEQTKLGKTTPRVKAKEIADASQIVDEILHAKVDGELRPALYFPDSWHGALVEGDGVLKAGWDEETNSPRLEYVPNEHCCWDPYALSDAKITFFIHEVWLTDNELWERQQAGIYDNRDAVIAASRTDDKNLDEWRREIAGPGNERQYLHKVVEFWGPQQLASDERVDKAHAKGKHIPAVDILATMYGDRYLLRVRKNKYAELMDNPTPFEKLPFFKAEALPKTNSTRGHQLVLWLRPIQRETNLTRNQRRQAVDMEMTRKTYYDENRLTNLKAMDAARYGGRVPTNGPPRDVIYDTAPQTSTDNMVQEEAMLDKEFQDVSGVTGMHLGTPEPGITRTATGATLATSRGDVKIDTIIQNIALTGVIPVLEFFAACALEYVSPEEVQAIIQSEEPPPASFKDLIRNKYAIGVEAGPSATSRNAQIQQVQAAIAAQAQAAQAAPGPAIATLTVLNARLLRLLGHDDLAQYWQMVEQGQGMAPGGQQQGMPNTENNAAMAQQGRMPTPQEVRR